ncbi:uncharacterized protein FOMMEDRAFT_166883, partial [Fomitiporia mediterranea MF3/22]|uniref:uncharacterized protein n=1 Tax=Fomitiporia mediterranea (strain MF3/22) TaxID=694068 RepID=UPI0004409BB6
MIPNYDPENGCDFDHSGTTHILLFDCFMCTPSGNNKAGINSPIIVRFKDRLENTHRERQAGKIDVHIFKATNQPTTDEQGKEGTKLNIQSFSKTLMKLANSLPVREQKKVLDACSQQVVEAYRKLTEAYVCDENKKVRDYILMFGDGSGAWAANKCAKTIERVGVLKYWNPYVVKEAFILSKKSNPDCKELCNFRLFRANYARVEVLGLWYNA